MFKFLSIFDKQKHAHFITDIFFIVRLVFTAISECIKMGFSAPSPSILLYHHTLLFEQTTHMGLLVIQVHFRHN